MPLFRKSVGTKKEADAATARLALFIFAAIMGLPHVGQVEGYFWPVTSQVVLSDPVNSPPPQYRHLWRAEAVKLRDCDFLRMEWFFGPRGGRRVQVRAEFTDPPTIRGLGVLVWEGLHISLPPDSTFENSHANVYHQCGPRPWVTRTNFYTSEG